MGERLKQAIADQSLDEARVICLRLKGTASSCGFEVISEKAAEALRSLDATAFGEESLKLLGQLADMSARVTSAKPPADDQNGS